MFLPAATPFCICQLWKPELVKIAYQVSTWFVLVMTVLRCSLQKQPFATRPVQPSSNKKGYLAFVIACFLSLASVSFLCGTHMSSLRTNSMPLFESWPVLCAYVLRSVSNLHNFRYGCWLHGNVSALCLLATRSSSSWYRILVSIRLPVMFQR